MPAKQNTKQPIIAKSASKSTNNSPVAVTLAPFWKRFFAWFYDLLGALGVFVLALVIGLLVLYVVNLPWGADFSQISSQSSQSFFWATYLFLSVQYYYVWCWVKGGQTVGMKAWRLQLYKADGQLLSWKEAYIRSFLSFAGLGNLWCLVDDKKRGWHDLIFDSRVIELPKNYYKEKNKTQKPLI